MSIQEMLQLARERYFQLHPELVESIEREGSTVAEALGVSSAEFCQQKRLEFFSRAARAAGLDAIEFGIRLVATSEEQANQWRLQNQRQRADAIGIEWADFKQLNGIVE